MASDEGAKRLRDIYLSRRRAFTALSGNADSGGVHPRWDGGRDRTNRRYKSVWPGLVDFACGQQLDFQVWVDALFDQAGRFDHVPWPTDLKSPGVVRAAKERKPITDAVHAINGVVAAVLQEAWWLEQYGFVPQGSGLRSVLYKSGASVLVRFGLAVRYGFTDIAAVLRQGAAEAYRAEPAAYRDFVDSEILGNLAEGQR